MNPAEYDRMFALENTYWWFVARRQLALGLLRRTNPLVAMQISKKKLDPRAFRVSALETLPPDRYRELQGQIEEVAEHMASLVESLPVPTLLDLGCGTGAVLEELSQFGEYVGLDMSGQALEYSRKRGLTALARGRGENLPFATNSFHAIMALDVFEHIEDDVSALKEALRVLKPGGTLVLSVPAFKMLWGPHDVALMHFRRYRRAELKSKLISAGFQLEKLSYSVFILFPLVVLFRIFEKRKRGDAQASLPTVPPWLNRMLVGLQTFEARLIHKLSLPWGSSLIAVARKPAPEKAG